MSSFNKVILVGNLTRDVELRYTANGSPVAGLGLAINNKYKTKGGILKEDACFIDVTVWGSQAEHCNTYLSKGSPVLIEGSLKLESWTDQASGQNRSKHVVNADKVQFLGSKNDNQQGQPTQQAPQASQPSYAPPAMPKAPASDFVASGEPESNIPF